MADVARDCKQIAKELGDNEAQCRQILSRQANQPNALEQIHDRAVRGETNWKDKLFLGVEGWLAPG